MARKTTGKSKTKARPKRRPVKAFSPPTAVDERRFRAESMTMDAFRDSPEFHKAVKAAEGNLKKAEEAVKKSIRGK